jgi:hypothetical protein
VGVIVGVKVGPAGVAVILGDDVDVGEFGSFVVAIFVGMGVAETSGAEVPVEVGLFTG